jgi:DNA polymerase-3 subunit delta
MTSMGKSLFWKDKALMQQLVSGWSAERLAAMLERTAALEKTIIFSDEPPVAALEEELTTIARAAQRRRVRWQESQRSPVGRHLAQPHAT